jgi:hypothetical protein
VTALLAIGSLFLTATRASAATISFDTDMMCYGKDHLLISMPLILNEDGYADAAFPEIWKKSSGVWKPWFTGSAVYNDDVPMPGGVYVGGPGTYPGVVWREFGTNVITSQWDYTITTGTEVAVKMYFLDGHTRAWRTAWALHVGDLGGRVTSCKIGQYQGYGWWW